MAPTARPAQTALRTVLPTRAPGIDGIDDAPGIEGTPAGDAVAAGGIDIIEERHVLHHLAGGVLARPCFAGSPPLPRPIPPAALCACARSGMHAKMSATVSPAKVCTFMTTPS